MVNQDYWNSKAITAHANDVNQMLSYMAIGFFFYDLLLSIPFDCTILSGKKRLKLVHFAYFSTKLSFLGFIAILLTIFWAQKDLHCQAQFQVLEMFMGLTVFTSSILLAFRTICVFQAKERFVVKTILIILGLGMLTAWMVGVNDVEAYWDSEMILSPYTQGQCVWTSVSSKYWVKYIITIIFDATVLILTTYGISRMAGTSKLGLTLIHQGIVYFLLTFLANLIIAIFTLLNLSPSMSLLVAVPQSAICVICSCRLQRELVQGQESRDQSYANPIAILPLTNEKGSDPSPPSKWNIGKRICRAFRISSCPSSTTSSEGVPIQQLSYGRGAMPSFISGTTAANNSLKSPPILSPGDEILLQGNDQKGGGYFDVARGSKRFTEQRLSTAALPTSDSHPILSEVCISSSNIHGMSLAHKS